MLDQVTRSGQGVGRRAPSGVLIVAVTLALPAATVACARRATETDSPPPHDEQQQMDLKSDLDAALATRIFFLHQSVGANLLAGAEVLARDAGRAFSLTDLDHAGAGPSSNWMHAWGGYDPPKRIDKFVSIMRGGLKTDLAFVKFCYRDFGPDTDVADLFARYQGAITTLKKERPDVRFAHVTVPLRTTPTGIKPMIKRLIGRDGEDLANVKRADFNDRLLRGFPSDPIFDLARRESTRPDGTRETFEYKGKVHYSLVPGYTNDGGHLNEGAQRALGADLIRFVARADKPHVIGTSH